MFPVLFLLMLVIVAAELWVLAVLARVIGLGGVVLLVVLTALAGSAAARWHGARAWRAIEEALQAGRMPTDEFIDGLLILVGGVMMITPGLLTDAVGLGLILPVLRPAARAALKSFFRRRISTMSARDPFAPGPTNVIDSTARIVDDEDED